MMGNGQPMAMTETEAKPDLYAGYETWKQWNRLFEVGSEEAAYFAGETTGTKIADADLLEIGFGSGSFLAWARSKNARIAGTEINETLLNAARSFGVEILPASFDDVAQANAARFDTVVAFDVFEHFSIAEILTRLAALQIMLKPGGALILRFPNAQSPFGLAPQNGDPTHKAALSRSVFEQLIQGTAFTVERYGPSFRIRGGSIPKRLVRGMRSAARNLIAKTLNSVYSQDIPWDPVVVLVLRRAK